MTAIMQILSPGDAQRLTQRIKLTASVVRDNLFKLRNLVDEAKGSNVWQILGFPSWTAYLADTLSEEPMRLGREERQELVEFLSGEGLSTRAIAPIVGASREQVRRDIATAPDTNVSPAPASPEPPVTVNESTGEVVEDAPVTVTETHTTKVVTGLDGKSYPVAPPKPRNEDTAERAKKVAEDESKLIAEAIETFFRFGNITHRTRVLTDWWPLGKGAVLPVSRGLFNPGQLRQIAGSLEQLATEMEQLDVY